jgi:hypothetical protein
LKNPRVGAVKGAAVPLPTKCHPLNCYRQTSIHALFTAQAENAFTMLAPKASLIGFAIN